MYEVETEQQPAQQLLTMSASLSRVQVGEFLSTAYPRLFQTLRSVGLAPAGAPIARYHVDEQAFHVTAGVPVDGQMHGELPSAVEVEYQPAATVATTMHVGSYEGLPAAFHAVMQWAQANGYTIVGDPWECYLDGPEVAEPRTKVCFPVGRP